MAKLTKVDDKHKDEFIYELSGDYYSIEKEYGNVILLIDKMQSTAINCINVQQVAYCN